MPAHRIAVMPGDGIGNQVLPESLRVLKAVGFDAEYIHADIGWDSWCDKGNALPDRTIDLLTKHKLGLFGAITSKPNKAAQAELKPELRGKGYVYYSPIVTMRQKFNLDICMRPCVGFTGNPLNYIRKRADSGFAFRIQSRLNYGETTNDPDNDITVQSAYDASGNFTQRVDAAGVPCRSAILA